MAKRTRWSEEQDNLLRANIHLSTQDLAKQTGVSEESVKKRFKELGIDRPTSKNDLARLRAQVFRSGLIETVPADWHELPATRSDAKKVGSFFYWDGAPCAKSGHISRRKTSSGGCWDCDYISQRDNIKNSILLQEKRKNSFKKWYEENKEDYLERQKHRKSSEESRVWYRAYEAKKRQDDIHFKIAKSLRDRLYKAVSRTRKVDSALNLVGCSLEKLKLHLETQFSEGMSWSNYGEWHIDHIRPCISFDLEDPEEQAMCFNYKNLRPLWGADNRSKGGIWGGIDPRAQKKDVSAAKKRHENDKQP